MIGSTATTLTDTPRPTGGIALKHRLRTVERRRRIRALLLVLPALFFLGRPASEWTGLLLVMAVMIWAFRRHIQRVLGR